jgi:glucans biosynthesis protein
LRGLAVALAAFLFASACAAFGFDDVAARAQQLAAASYKKPDVHLPKELQELTYDQYRDIRFKPERAWWRNAKLPFELMFFHQGLYYNYPVALHEIAPDGVRDMRFDADLFDYGANTLDPKALQGLGYAGFRVHYSINSPK